MIRSYRFRLVLLSCLLTGITLLAFGAGSWWLIRNWRVERLEQDVRSHAEREVSRTRSPEEWRRMEATLRASLGAREGDDVLLLVADSAGGTLYQSAHWPGNLALAALEWPAQPRSNPDGPRPPPQTALLQRRAAGTVWHIGLASNDRARVAIGADDAVIDADMQGTAQAFALALPVALLLSGLAGWLFSARTLRPLRKLTETSRQVTAEGLDKRISIAGEDQEFVDLIGVFNGMLERLQRSFEQARRFSADAAHELKTPLAILQGQLERAIQRAEAGSALQVELSAILDEVRRLSTISGKLLLLSQADAGRLRLHRERVPLSALLEELLEDVHMLAPGLSVSGRIEPQLWVSADAALLRQVLHNLISNAIKYNRPQGWIRLAAATVAQSVEVSVTNASAGIPQPDAARLFERFFRADPARNRSVDGAGLGLSVSREIARAHGGDLWLAQHAGGEVQFVLRLPAMEAQQGTGSMARP